MKHVPNILTTLRLLATPVLFWLTVEHRYWPVIYLFIAIAVTDIADGFIARRFQAQSKLGAILDPIADKLLLSGMFLTMWIADLIPGWIGAVVLGRDALILAGAGVLTLMGKRRAFPPSAWGKLSTFVQILYVSFQLGVLADVPVDIIALFLQWAVAVFAVVSIGDYARRMS